jgi:PhoPQ-activated pathogenicity-related protein
MMDPYTYRSLLTLPKLLIVGTNDPYWTVDAMSLYFDDLAGPKSIRQVPNAGHSLDGGRDGALVTLAAFFRHVVTQTPLPTLAWEFHNSPERLRLQWTSDAAPRSARLWQARSATLDFRKAQWEPTDMTAREQSFAAEVLRENGAHAALFGELQFRFEELDFSLTTLVFRR